jgi:hypothetical protein
MNFDECISDFFSIMVKVFHESHCGNACIDQNAVMYYACKRYLDINIQLAQVVVYRSLNSDVFNHVVLKPSRGNLKLYDIVPHIAKLGSTPEQFQQYMSNRKVAEFSDVEFKRHVAAISVQWVGAKKKKIKKRLQFICSHSAQEWLDDLESNTNTDNAKRWKEILTIAYISANILRQRLNRDTSA